LFIVEKLVSLIIIFPDGDGWRLPSSLVFPSFRYIQTRENGARIFPEFFSPLLSLSLFYEAVNNKRKNDLNYPKNYYREIPRRQ